jgi:hypothetical protein
MTTFTVQHEHFVRHARVNPIRREWMEAAVAGIAFVLLLPGASLLMSVLQA